MPTAPKDLAWKIVRAWGAYSIEPELDGRIQPSDPHIVCRKCWRPKRPEEFHLSRANRDGRSHCCKACHAELYTKPAEDKRKASRAAKRELRTGKCQRCGRRAPLKDISRRTCPACRADIAQRSAGRVAFKAAHDGKPRAATPEYRRLQRESEAAKQGRTLRDYVAREERERRAAMLLTEREADQIRKRFSAALLREFHQIASTAFPEAVSALRKEQAALARRDYQRNLVQERLRTATYKAAHPETVRCYHETRQARIDATCDGSATKESVQEAKAAASRCAYCDCPFEDAQKQTDHMVALCHGGEHSLRNIVIVCSHCNARKASLTYEQWIERIEPEHRERVQRLWIAHHPDLDRVPQRFVAYVGSARIAGTPADGQIACG